MSRYFGVVGKGFFEPLPQPFNTRGGGHPLRSVRRAEYYPGYTMGAYELFNK